MKRVLAMLLVLATVLSSVACGKKKTEAQETTPTTAATTAPTAAPTAAPTGEATAITAATENTTAATEEPATAPTEEPTTAPTEEPTTVPTTKPTEKPTTVPTAKPTATPTTKATVKPTEAPTVKPSTAPTIKPTVPAETKPLQDGQWQSQRVIGSDLITLALKFVSDKDFLLTESYGKDFNQLPKDMQTSILANKEEADSLVKVDNATYYIGAGGAQEGTYAVKGSAVTVTFVANNPTTLTLERVSGDQLKVTAISDPEGIFDEAQVKAGVIFTWMEAPKHTHTWTDATCQDPKTCYECGATEGSVGTHTFVDGICTFCQAADIVDPNTNLKICGDTTEEYISQAYIPYDEETVSAPGISFWNDGGYGEGIYCLLLEAMFTSNTEALDTNRPPLTYSGKDYYRIGGGMSPAEVDLTDTEILITKDDGGTIKLVMLGNGNLKVTASTDSSYPENMILSTAWSYLS